MVGFFDRVRRSDFPPLQYVNRAQEGGFRVAVKDLEAGYEDKMESISRISSLLETGNQIPVTVSGV